MTNVFIPAKDVFGRRPDGRRFLVAAAGVPIRDTRARELGLIGTVEQVTPVNPGPVGPSETKQAGSDGDDGDGPEEELDELSDEIDLEEYATADAIALAAEHGIDLLDVEGTGKDGRILVRDVKVMI
jgi:pyruvate/2-oxoglutarate dehydrogenase complex dihydrolipoamide acyltransferase (E2) component